MGTELMGRMSCSNNVVVCGTVGAEFQYSHDFCGEKFYTSNIITQRLSGIADRVPLTVSDRFVDVGAEWTGRCIKVFGKICSYNKQTDNGRKLILSVFSDEVELLEGKEFRPSYKNEIRIDGFICKNPIYRKTPLGREIAEIMIAVNRPYGKSDYIPCICWGRNAKYASRLSVGAHIEINGRIQSREYVKRFPDGSEETRTAYEVSAERIDLFKETED